MRRWIENRWVHLVFRLGVGAVFLWSGFVKLRAPLPFADSIATFNILPMVWVNVMALGLPPLEILLGFLLVVGFKRREVAFGIVVLTTIFLLALGQALARGLKVDCGCFGGGTPSVAKAWGALVRDLLLLFCAVVLYLKAANTDRELKAARGSGALRILH
ncbi:MAG: DoxX family membrane protein [Verrucomicrobiae bacterium]|nr:DoxX family membrane protein [Verrucomicrobiae bacterium]